MMFRIFAAAFYLSLALFAISNASQATPASDVTASYCQKFDFGQLLTPRTDFLGFIAPNYRRLHIQFLSVSRSPSTPCLYLVKGKSIVKGNASDFTGTIEGHKIERYARIGYGLDDEYKDKDKDKGKGVQSEGEFDGHYEFREDRNHKFSGVLKGEMILYWYVDKGGKIVYDDINNFSDAYNNNQYSGSWTEYGKASGKTANWGGFRIPNSGDLDIGAGEFAPDPKYKNQGWEDLVR
jgi:hypothetical protein